MKNYYIESVINKIAQEIAELIDQKVISEDKKIVLYGLDTFSFAMRTILANFGFRVDCYISDDQESFIRYKRNIKAVSARYLNSTRDLIEAFSVDERLKKFDEAVLVLSGSENCPRERIEKLRYQKNKNFFQLYDWERDDFIKSMQGKRKMTLQEIQSVEKTMLYMVDRFCLDRNLKYWVCGGTLLGTVRHKGFIPWDDDVDIFMPWEDYCKFLEEFTFDSHYSLMIPGKVNRKDYYDLFAKIADNRTLARENLGFLQKVHPVTLDIFPLIGMPGEKGERHLFFEKYQELDKRIWEDFYANNGNLDVFNKWYPEQEAFQKKYRFEESEYVGVLATAYGESDCTARKVYDTTIRMPFEDIEVNVPCGYQEYLDNLYGKDWMEIPEENQRISHHNMEAYWV